MSAVEKALRGCAITAGALIALVVAMALWYFHSLGPGPQPDVGKAARSATAETADQAVTAQVDDRIGRLRTALPWATYLGTAVADVCSTEEKPIAFVGVHESWLPVTCTRTDTLYEAFDGDFRQHLAELDTVLADAGWRPGDLTLVPRRGGTPGLAAYFDRMHEPPRDPSPSEIARAAAEPKRGGAPAVRCGSDGATARFHVVWAASVRRQSTRSTGSSSRKREAGLCEGAPHAERTTARET